MPRLQAKRFATPDSEREVPKVRFAIVTLDDTTVTFARFEPGWHWREDLQPILGTKSCEIHHFGHAISGVLHVVMDDGQELDIGPDSVYEMPAGHDAWVVGDEAWTTIDWTSGRAMTAFMDGPGERVVATILFCDIVASTATAARLGDAAWHGLLRDHNSRVRAELNIHRGREIATTGDGFLAVFESATRAVRCAQAMVRAAVTMGIAIRVGIHTGEIEFVGDDARGLALHAAARIMAVAGPNEVVISSTSRDLLEGSGIELEDAGSHELKGLSGSRQLYRATSVEHA